MIIIVRRSCDYYVLILTQSKQLSQGTIDLSVHVLTMGYWPPYAPMEVILPSEVRISIQFQYLLEMLQVVVLISVICYVSLTNSPQSCRCLSTLRTSRSSTWASTVDASFNGSLHLATVCSRLPSNRGTKSYKYLFFRVWSYSCTTLQTSSTMWRSRKPLEWVCWYMYVCG